jgi:serine/threonine protein phosphatase PrpC
MQWKQKIEYDTHTDVGMRRDNNEDNCVVQMCSDEETWRNSGHLFLVADGMGGHAVGELASKLAAENVPHAFFKNPPGDVESAIRNALSTANHVIFERGTGNPEFQRMGTTCSTLVLSPAGATIGHVGDSRVYRIRDEHIEQLTFDHSLHWELMRDGRLTANDAFANKNVITRCLGPEPSVEVDVEGPFPVLPGDKYVLCSDGLTAHLDDADVGQIAAYLPADKASRALVNLANLRGGSDNCTVVVVDVTGGENHNSGNGNKGQPPLWLWILLPGLILAVLAIVLFAMKLTTAAVVCLVVAAIPIGTGCFLRPKSEKAIASTDAQTSKPYQTASARLDPDTIDQLLAQVDSYLTDPSSGDLEINAEELNTCRQKAAAALKAQQPADALHYAVDALNLCMDAVEARRRSLDLSARWGKDTESGANGL